VRDAELAARKIAIERVRKFNASVDPEICALEEKFAASLGTRVRIEKKENGGKLMIEFFSNDDLEDILNMLNQNPTPTHEVVGGPTENVGHDGFLVTTNKGTYKTKTILVTTGSSRKKLDIPGAKEFEGKGISYCASCDGPFFADKNVVVIGGGNAGFETAAQLLAYCKNVTLISRGEFRADLITMEKVLANPKMTALTNAIPVEIKGDPSKKDGAGNFVKSFEYKRTTPFVNNFKIEVEGIFVEIGHTPATGFVESLVDVDEFKRIKIDHKNQRTSLDGIWAAGDCTDALYHQNNIAAGDAVKALEDIYLELARMAK